MPDVNTLLALRRMARAVHLFAWKQGKRKSRYWLPAGKQDVPANRLYGAKAERAAAAQSGKKAKGDTKTAAGVSEARATYERAKKNGVSGELLEKLKRRAEGLSNAPAGGAGGAAAPATLVGRGRAEPPKPAAPSASKPGGTKIPYPPPPSSAIRAEVNPVLRAGAKNSAPRQTARPRPATKPPAPSPPVPPKPDGSPDLPALKGRVEEGVASNRGIAWGYDFTRAKSALADAGKQIDGYAKSKPAAAVRLAKEVTGQQPADAADAADLLKAWVGETVSLLGREPSRLDRKTARRS